MLFVFDLRELARTLTRSHTGMRTAPEVGAKTVNAAAALSKVSNLNGTRLNVHACMHAYTPKYMYTPVHVYLYTHTTNIYTHIYTTKPKQN